MLKKRVKSRGRGVLALGFWVLAVWGVTFCLGGEAAPTGVEGVPPSVRGQVPRTPPQAPRAAYAGVPGGTSGDARDIDANAPSSGWDPARYISLDEIRPGMEGYCLTEYGIDGIEKFGLKVIDVVREFEPGRDVILVQGTDERFIHTGPVAGCSGSPVYIDGRLAGALAFAWTYSKDPVYGATPIGDMLRVGLGKAEKPVPAFSIDYSRPIDLSEIDRQISRPQLSARNRFGGANVLPCPLIASGLGAEACEQLNTAVEPFGFTVVPGMAGGSSEGEGAGDQNGEDGKRQLVPGACLVVPLVSGDMTIAVYGTVTEVRDGTVYGFGHPFMGYGAVDLPMATGKVHTVITSLVRSNKLAKVVETVGAFTNDEGAGVLGKIGAEAQTFPLAVRIERYNDIERAYNCRAASNRILTPTLIRAVISGAALYLGDFPPDHTVKYKTSIALKGFEPIIWENVSTGFGTLEMAVEASSAAALLMNNPYDEVGIESMEFDISVAPKDTISHIWSADLADTTVKAGERIGIDVVVESVKTQMIKYRIDMEIPEDLRAGKYELTLCGSQDYGEFLLKTVPHKFIGQDLPDLVEALRDSLQVRRDRLYCYLVLPSSGIIIEKAELPDLPATKMLVLQSLARPVRTQLYPNWIEKTLETGTVVINKKTVQITIEE